MSGGEALVRLDPDGPPAALLDAAFHAAALVAPARIAHAPFALEEAWFGGPLERAAFALVRRRAGDRTTAVDVAVADEAGTVLASLTGLALRPVARPAAAMGTPLASAAAGQMTVLAPRWRAEAATPRPASAQEGGEVVMLGATDGAFQAALREAEPWAAPRRSAKWLSAGCPVE